MCQIVWCNEMKLKENVNSRQEQALGAFGKVNIYKAISTCDK